MRSSTPSRRHCTSNHEQQAFFFSFCPTRNAWQYSRPQDGCDSGELEHRCGGPARTKPSSPGCSDVFHGNKLQLRLVSLCARSWLFSFGSYACNRLQYLFNLIVTYWACSGIRQGVPCSSGGLDFSSKVRPGLCDEASTGPSDRVCARKTNGERVGETRSYASPKLASFVSRPTASNNTIAAGKQESKIGSVGLPKSYLPVQTNG